MSVIDVEHLEKVFRIPHEKRTTVFEALTGLLRPTHYKTFQALQDVTFSVEEGEMLGIIGENGSGKSTLLKILAGIMRPTSGTVSINRRLTPFLELGVGFNPDFTAVENIRTYATIMGLSKREINGKIDNILEFAGLETFRDAKLKNFSSGMQVRLAFSTAIQTDPEILLMDEVLAVGDMEFQQKCMDVLNRYRNEGVTIVFVSHDLGSVRRFCDRTLLLRQGEQVALGETDEVIDRYVYGRTEKPVGEEGPTQAKEPENRRGDRKVEITGVKFIDKFGRENMRFNSFDPMTVRIFYEAHERIPDPNFGVALYSEQGTYLYGTNTELKGIYPGALEGRGHIDLRIREVPMIAGNFRLTVAVVGKNNVTYDWLDKQHSFEVIKTGKDDGMFGLVCEWVFDRG
ncbi:ABC transporter ATP-binding protein [Methanoculleus bourgensis]|uniref:ABC transporter ATP-binding protein n=1 Tax=Methanoculleus bourgensis TaxID=83986 RepID=UPI0022EFB25C|nr:ABC transporter ATP-binding protein [Methanoculleus bourgensis]GLI45397.1 ABC transporter ATP-binding protein [Methanoculleus bourgensis]